MGLFFAKLMWRILPVLSVLVVLVCSYLIWDVKFRHWWKSGHLKRVSLVALVSLVVCFSVLLLLGYSTQSKIPFGTKIADISTEQQLIKEEMKRIEAEKVAAEEKDDQIKEKLEAALDVADNELGVVVIENQVSTIVTKEWFAENQQLSDQLSDELAREDYTSRFEAIKYYFLK